jgi:hypothetical protein
MLRRVALVRTVVSKERSASIIRVTRIGKLGTLAVTNARCEEILCENGITCSVLRMLVTANVVPTSPILVTLTMEVLRSSQKVGSYKDHTANIPDDGILHSHRREKLKSYKATLHVVYVRCHTQAFYSCLHFTCLLLLGQAHT